MNAYEKAYIFGDLGKLAYLREGIASYIGIFRELTVYISNTLIVFLASRRVHKGVEGFRYDFAYLFAFRAIPVWMVFGN